ncbi:DUF4747 family protein [Marinobacter nauticus]|uniref:DUF4747 family protein n=1 Tax=Marinobacter nauticus TaxID=2743 RepID=UPI001C585F74|nr:DUF4747 family protein [Marinobacter nauticus]MBW3199149.1 DUF4747 family protein [Marinobacter nauticus]MBY6184559.1 DUF4747 family protein [Marinobacter nauticus]
MKRMTLSAINIAIHPHPTPEVYERIFKRSAIFLKNKKQAIHVRGDQFATLTYPLRVKSANSKGDAFAGEILKFTEIKLDGDWLDLSTLESKAPEDIKDSVSIPEELRPNLHRFSYAIFPEVHKIVFQTEIGQSKTSPNIILHFFEKLFEIKEIKEGFDSVNLTIVPEKNKVEEILNIYQLKKLKITLTKPNPDELDDIDIEFEKHLNEENADYYIQEYSSKKEEQLTPSKRTRAIAKLASINGEVWGKGKDREGKVITETTKSHNMQKKFRYDEKEKELPYTRFVRFAQDAIDDL